MSRDDPIARFVHREMVVLVTLIGIAAAAFFLTRMVARSNRNMRLRDAAHWQQQGTNALAAGRAGDAAAALRSAAALAPEVGTYQLELGRALAANAEYGQARQVLLQFREHRPEDASVNVELARLESRGGDAAAAVRYYQHATAALWSDRDTELRRQIRLELVDVLLSRNLRSRALSELLVVSATLPDNATIRTRVGRMLLDAGDARRAEEQFAAVLRRDPRNPDALEGAGTAAFERGDYSAARRYLDRVPPASSGAGDLRLVTEHILARDPLATRIGAAERQRRLRGNVEYVSERLSRCAGLQEPDQTGKSGPLESEIERLRQKLRRRTLARDDIEAGVHLVWQIEQEIARVCKSTTPVDRALVLIAHRHDLGVS
jgi:tetratricopeptide (TPR) repeat protein